ncbi:DNA-processing protein DprA [Micrococcus sp.]|uniref:DNA-processing protein DprA n=1 Tax=Micrococcus sp. TaxID=1271 RepID=UPI002A9145ED|nr:DNA-processing protein DprA [Micrococcus sp.]MDY6054307.1 DNA-processing protein DprA [Micrococcus sp.]
MSNTTGPGPVPPEGACDSPPEGAHLASARPDGPRLARAALTRLVEPGDDLAVGTVAALGPERALAVLTGADRLQPAEQDLLADTLGSAPAIARRWHAGLARWAPRAAQLHPERDLVSLHRLGGGLLIPEDEAWPTGLDDLGPAAPLGLWFRGTGALPTTARALAVVGSREATAYGRTVTAAVAEAAVHAGVCVVSGGAYGIDGAAHRAALRAGAQTGTSPVPTVAVLAGGLDRLYPAGHEELLREVMAHGLLVSEMPPGASPTRHRFLHRNRVIAALCGAVVVVEARWRSGAQNTAGHALGLGRELGVVPGPITSASSAGCHRLLQETPARLLTDPAQALALLPAPAQGSDRAAGTATSAPAPEPAAEETDSRARAVDGLSMEELLVHEALPLRQATTVDRLTVSAGLAPPSVLAALTRLQRRGLAERIDDRWRRARA